MARIRIKAGDVTMTATLNRSRSAQALMKVLPFSSEANRWGQEVYCDVPLQIAAEDPQAQVPSGTIAYWPEGPSFCIFFGQTPYSPVNVLGKLDGKAEAFAQVQSGEAITVEATE